MKNKKGITLIALVITIIILLILAAVSLNMIIGENGIVNKARTSKDTYDDAKSREEANLAEIEARINALADGIGIETVPYETLSPVTSVAPSSTNDPVETPEPEETKTFISTGETEVTNGTTKPYLPGSNFEVSTKSTENTVAQGLVVREKTTKDEYVWVVVPRSSSIYTSAGLDITNFNNTNLAKIRNDLETYTAVFSNTRGDNSEDLTAGTTVCSGDYWYDGTKEVSSGAAHGANNMEDPLIDASESEIDASALSDNSGCGLSFEQYQNKYKAMLESVYKYGGFYIARYEAGIVNSSSSTSGKSSSTRIALTDTTTKPASVKDMIPYNFVYCKEAERIAENAVSGYCESSLLFGVQWDLALKFLKERTSLTLEELKGETSGSMTWGNFRDSNDFTIESGKYTIQTSTGLRETWTAYTTDEPGCVESEVKKKRVSGYTGVVLLTTGAAPSRNMKQNICDLAGNLWEWTLNCSVNATAPCYCRGGSFNNTNDRPAAYHNMVYTDYGHFTIGFRVALY